MFKKLIRILLGQAEGYVSSADRFLEKLRRENPHKSASQVAEITKYKRISRLRENVEKGGKADKSGAS